VGTTLSVNSIQDVYTPVMVMVTPLTKGGPVASVLAMAYKADLRDPKSMDIQSDGSGRMIHSIPLDNLGLVLQIINNKSASSSALLIASQSQYPPAPSNHSMTASFRRPLV
jgi:hypothetical protein